MKKTFKPITSLWFMAGLVGIYQLPIIDNYLNQKDIITNISNHFSAPKEFQQFVENSKISISAKYASLTTLEQPPVVEIALNKDIPIINNKENVVSLSLPSNKKEIEQKTNTSLSSSDGNTLSLSTESEKIVENKNIKENIVVSLQAPNTTTVLIDKSTAINEQTSTLITKQYCKENCKVLMIGDSVMGDVEFSMIRLLKKSQPSWKVISGYKVSSGLTNQQYYDWPKVADKLVTQYKPDYVLVLMGTNDAQNMIINGKAAVFGKESWVQEYERRVRLIVDNLEENSPYWLWVQLPTVKNNSFNQRLEVIREAQNHGTENRILETKSILGENSQMVNMKLRASDGTHLNATGANLLAQHIYTKLTKDTE